jgi:hypothetical protein
MIMKSYLNINLWAGILVVLLWLRPASVSAQLPNYNYDSVGNLTSVSAASTTPVILTQPQPQLLVSNSFAAFSVVASGSGFSYQWLSNGVPILGATNDSFLIGNLIFGGTNLGNFSVIVSNSFGAVTSAPAALWPDINDNDIPDWWEMLYFGNLNQSAAGDFDGDGVNNLNEYLEGTNPTNAASFNPRLHVQSAHGTVAVSPLQPYYSQGQLVSLSATPDAGHQFVAWSGSITGTKPSITVLMDTNKNITGTFGFPLSIALDNPNLLWTTSGDLPWFGQAEVSEDGMGAAQSGPIVSTWNGSTFVGEQTTLQTIVDTNQTLLLSFWWNVSSRPTNALTFGIDGVAQASISGEAVGWQLVQTNLVAGRHTLTWTYTKGPVDIPTGVPFADAAWVDQVTLTSTNGSGLPPPPLLSIAMTGTNKVVVSWATPSVNFVLQQNASIGSNNWQVVTNTVVTNGGLNQVTISPAIPLEFYRLSYP